MFSIFGPTTITNGSEITGNDTDVNLKFGTRATFQRITIGTIVSDRNA